MRPLRILPLFALVTAATQTGATNCGTITRDPGFDLWCGEALCAWKLERGDIRRVATWHESDAGVELLDPASAGATGTAIEQFTSVDSTERACIQFDLIADVVETAQVELGVDIYGDGTVERTFPVPTSHWRAVSFLFAVEPPFTGIRFELAKRGAGRAVLARMRARLVERCDGVAGLAGGPAPLGARCLASSDCASAICSPINFFESRCTGCAIDGQDCAAGEVCGLTEPGVPERAVPVDCVPAGARAIAEPCLGDGECGSGICELGRCSACRSAAACGGAACEQAYLGGPLLCAPGRGLGAPGAACVADADCASASCTGPTRLQCPDGRTCASDANCPAEGDLVPGSCTAVGIQGGTCR